MAALVEEGEFALLLINDAIQRESSMYFYADENKVAFALLQYYRYCSIDT